MKYELNIGEQKSRYAGDRKLLITLPCETREDAVIIADKFREKRFWTVINKVED